MTAPKILALLFAISLTASSCALGDSIRANGDVRSEPRSLPAFSSVALEGSGTLRVHEGAQSVVITADSNVLPYIETGVSGSRLSIGLKPFTSVWGNATLEYEVSVPSLDGIALTGSGDAAVDAFSGSSFDARISGSGDLAATLDYSSVSLHISGSGDAALRGSVADAQVSISGSGSLSSKGLTASRAGIIVSGSGGVELRVVDSLDATLYGSGVVLYWGNPAVSQSVLGSGRVLRAGN